MPELSVDDVEAFTRGRLTATDPETALILSAALNAARNYCGWNVNPVVTDDSVILDGPCSRVLVLPTRKLITLTSITEDGVPMDLTTLRWSLGGPPNALERPVSVRKKHHGWWKSFYQCYDVVMTHGYTDDEAGDWRYAVLSMINTMSQTLTSGRSDANMLSKKVDDVTYSWTNPFATVADTAVYSVNNILDGYSLPGVEFF